MKRRTFLTGSAGLALGTLATGACTTTKPEAPSDKSARRREIDSGVDGTLSRLYSSVNGSRELGNRARGILVFPKTLSAGFIVGGEYGDGALRSGGATRGYYRLVSGSVGWQIGAQSKSVILMFMTQDAYDKFVRSSGWTVGVDATVALATIGANGVLDTNTAQQPIVGFVLTNAGLMAGLSFEGSKITRLDL
ncbi:BPSL1445 family SYLF domain-containing lipoprotein [Cupriavidus taiwanensis]|uniref:BPSL1445 family SYLF domain-containing lipoprotein n=1 Tax=Cupriavidus taiwanensis TaxID=164546 RepID=UPI000E107E3C|nr:YSC84-related protein [Cupriavidus taiwanensis]SOY50549.1 putative lipoprotein [Cupriavidus taiwanensis]SOY50808.1 putative lipoprotein [Cupriavidus taiwanensis]SOY83712.1 putative lipoprotein [Cupriavidus taiwanensis]SOZ57925.1 putative lipoprotein [Cupriavidus taiwanensis]SOZ79747.1 putative lipoprotein [Cupriavidus taiwanensis]